MKNLVIFSFLVVISVVTGSKMQMPSFATVGDKITLECKLDHDPKTIEHVKWYKDNQIFYTVIPADSLPATKIDLQGVPFDMDESKMDQIILKSITEDAAGLYTCELKTSHGMARMSGTLTVDKVSKE